MHARSSQPRILYVDPNIYMYTKLTIISLLCCRKTALPSDLLPIFEEDVRKWHHNYGQESEEARSPLIT